MDINLTNVKPLFAHDVAVSTIFKARKTKGGKTEKEAYIEFVFIDMITKLAISRVVLSVPTVKNLPKILNDILNKIEKELKSKEIRKEPKIETKRADAKNYVG